MSAAHVHDGDCNICYWPCEDSNCDKPQVFVCPNHVLPGMERTMAERAHQTAQEAANPKPKVCNHPPLGVCKNCDLF